MSTAAKTHLELHYVKNCRV